MSLLLIGTTIGGIGLFLLGMRLMTEGLKVAAGEMLRDILARWTRTRLRGLASGILITGVVQSSSAVTVAAIGFVNAGVLTLSQAMWVVFGSNIGTTMTGWIVAMVGFDIKVELFALPLIGIGMFLTLTGGSGRRAATGEALAGFGLFFLGIAALKTAFGGIGESLDPGSFLGTGLFDDAILVLVGFVLTSLVQSSSAVMAIALTATVGGVLTIESGAALVIGANMGTTTTALLAVIGATANAKRVAISHVAFNLLTGLVALALLPVLLLAVSLLERAFAVATGPAVTLALFHTVFNILGVLLMWPLAQRLENWLSGRFVSDEENESRPRHLDRNSLGLTHLALNAILLELRRVADIALTITTEASGQSPPDAARLVRRSEVVTRLGAEIMRYVQELGMTRTPAIAAGALTHPVRAVWHFSELAELGPVIVRQRQRIGHLPAERQRDIAACAQALREQCRAAALAFHDPDRTPPDDESFKAIYNPAKSNVLTAAANGDFPPEAAERALDMLADLKLAARHLDRASKRYAALAAATRFEPEDLSDTRTETPPPNRPGGSDPVQAS